MLVKISSKASEDIVAALAKHEEPPEEVRSSLTWDRGSESAAHAKFTLATSIDVYFFDPHAP